jgi:branched-subunit amino acid aminotransferase/4-amino-4-deoxychorismate lyase
MSKGKYILVNGSFMPTEEYQISLAQSEALHFSEKFRAIRTSFPFFDETLELIRYKLLYYNQLFPEFTNDNGLGLKRQLERVLTKNKHFLGAIAILTFRFVGKNVHYTIQSEKTEPVGYELNEKGLYIEIIRPIQKSTSSLSSLSLGSEIYWDIAACHLKESVADELLIVNTSASIIEAPESNIYLIKRKTVRGASSERGAYVDRTRPLMLDLFCKLKLDYTEDEEITEMNLREAEELLIVNSLKGIRWVIGFEDKRYFNNTIRKINELFNKQISS